MARVTALRLRERARAAMLSADGRGFVRFLPAGGALHPAQALANRFQAAAAQPLTGAGRQLIVETMRLTWQTPETLLSGLPALRAQAAVMQRRGDRSGMHQAGALLREYCEQEQGGMTDEA